MLVAASLIVIPAAMVLSSVVGDRYGRYADDSWKALLMLLVLAATYLVSRRLLLTVLVAAVTVGVASWVMSPNLAADRNGDATVLAHLDQQAGWGNLTGYQDVAVAEVDLNAAQPVALAGIGADDTTVMEVGSMTKAMTGLVIADAVRRGEIRMDAPVATYLPRLKGSPAGTATMHELVTHTSGYAEFGAATLRQRRLEGAARPELLHRRQHADDQRGQEPDAQRPGQLRVLHAGFGHCRPGRRSGSPHVLPGPDAHPAVRAARDVPHRHRGRPRTRRRRQVGRPVCPVQPWVMDAYAPGAAAVSTTGDLAKLATALLNGTAPGMAALDPTTPTDRSNTRIGDFWQTSTWQTGQTITHHAGQTGGYASYLGLDRPGHKAVIVLSDVANDASDLGSQLLANRN